jgi:hypothetical protein
MAKHFLSENHFSSFQIFQMHFMAFAIYFALFYRRRLSSEARGAAKLDRSRTG